MQESLRDKLAASFPFAPYQIQLDFCESLYKALDEGKKFCVFESPTGTGKSLSIICSAMQWLLDNEENYRLLLKQKSAQASDDLPVWLEDLGKQVTEEEFLRAFELEREALESKCERLKQFTGSNKKEEKGNEGTVKKNKDEYKEFLEEDYSDKENDTEVKAKEEKNQKRTNYIYNKYGIKNELEEQKSTHVPLKIIYATRTHSQIKQFVSEIRRTSFAGRLRVVVLASRNALCVNSEVNKLGRSSSSINEACKNKIDKIDEKMCPYYENFREHVEDLEMLFFASQNKEQEYGLLDIEDMQDEGTKHGICSYYQSKLSVNSAQVICVPYASLIDPATRDSLAIDLDNAVVIFDEAHNLLDAESEIFSREISLAEAEQVLREVKNYTEKYSTRMKEKSLTYISELESVCQALITTLENVDFNSNSVKKIRLGKRDSKIFLVALNLDEIDVFEMIDFIQRTRLCQKIHYFSRKNTSNAKDSGNLKSETYDTKQIVPPEVIDLMESKQANGMEIFCDFLRFCVQEDNDSAIVLVTGASKEERKIKLLNLDAFSHLEELLQKSLTVVLTGGTMEPLAEYEMFAERLGIDKCTFFSCEHIISAENFSALVVSSHNNIPLCFNHENQGNQQMQREAVQFVLKTANSVPGGVIVFCESYKNLEILQKIFEELREAHEQLFFDDRNKEEVCKDSAAILMADYKEAVSARKGPCLLISVVGGRLSEGINFNDELARAVILIGMPYANYLSAELEEKMEHYDRIYEEKTGKSLSGHEYYTNLCMKQVNQTVGRCIRHKDDYAMIFLLDERYAAAAIVQKLPKWVQERVEIMGKQSEAKIEESLQKFFQIKQANRNKKDNI